MIRSAKLEVIVHERRGAKGNIAATRKGKHPRLEFGLGATLRGGLQNPDGERRPDKQQLEFEVELGNGFEGERASNA